jgi:hypothetical protein
MIVESAESELGPQPAVAAGDPAKVDEPLDGDGEADREHGGDGVQEYPALLEEIDDQVDGVHGCVAPGVELVDLAEATDG